MFLFSLAKLRITTLATASMFFDLRHALKVVPRHKTLA